MSSPFVLTWPIAGPSSPPVSAGGRNNFNAISEHSFINVCLNNDFLNWPSGDTSDPAWWRSTGSPTITRCGVGLADTQHSWGKFCAKIASGGSQGVLEQRIIQSGSFDAYQDYYRTRRVTFGSLIYTASASVVRVSVYDGVDETDGSLVTTTSSWVWAQVTHDLNSAATELVGRIKVNSSSTAYASGPTFYMGPVVPRGPVAPQYHYGTLQWTFPGTISTGDDRLGHFPSFGVPAVVLGAHLYAGTAPTGAAIQVQFAKNGTADIFTTKPAIAASSNSGSQAVDGTYANRCLDHNDRVHFDLDQVGSSVKGSDLQAMLRCAVPMRPMLAWNDFEEGD